MDDIICSICSVVFISGSVGIQCSLCNRSYHKNCILSYGGQAVESAHDIFSDGWICFDCNQKIFPFYEIDFNDFNDVLCC